MNPYILIYNTNSEIFVFVLLSLGGTLYNQTNLCHLRYIKKKYEVSHDNKTFYTFTFQNRNQGWVGMAFVAQCNENMIRNIAKIFEGFSKIIAK